MSVQQQNFKCSILAAEHRIYCCRTLCMSMQHQNSGQMLSFGSRTSSLFLQNIVYEHVATNLCLNVIFWQPNIETSLQNIVYEHAATKRLDVVFWQHNIEYVSAECWV